MRMNNNKLPSMQEHAKNFVVKTVDDYIAALPLAQRTLLQKVRIAIKSAAPQAEEVISYGMPAFNLNGALVWYAVYKEHIGLYPKPSAIKAFNKELAGYKTSKGAIQFPVDKRIPITLIKNIVKFRVKENKEKAQLKSKKPANK